MESYIGKICPYCGSEIKEGDAVKVCPSCGIPHHEACWIENKGCTTFGCKEQNCEEQPAVLCTVCRAPNEPGKKFCSNCGAPLIEKKKKFCGSCGAEIDERQAFCPECGARTVFDTNANEKAKSDEGRGGREKRKKSRSPLIIGAVAAVLLIAAALVYLFLPKKPTAVSLSDSEINVVCGETYKLKYEVEPEKTADFDVKWSSDDETVATVEKGIVTGVGEGVCTVKIKTDNGKSSSCKVTVVKPAVTSITLSRPSATVERGNSFTLSCTVEPENAEYTVSWSSDDEDVATVENGVVTAYTVGTCSITAKTDNGKTSVCRVTVTMPTVEKKAVKTWKCVRILNFEDSETTDCSDWGWKLYLYDNNTGSFYMDSDNEIVFFWIFTETNEYGNDVYMTSEEGIYFIYAKEYGEIWLYIETDSLDLCITCE